MARPAEARQERIRTETEHRRQMRAIATRLSSTLGAEFFESVVKHLASTFDADCGYLAEVAGIPTDRIRTVAMVQDGGPSGSFEQVLAGTAAGQVLSDGLFRCSRDVKALFPLDEVMQNLEAEAFIGTRLLDSSGRAVGILALAFKRPITNMQVVRPILEAFIPRAAAELERKQSDDLRRQNEERHQMFISRNPDAMWRIELDQPISLSLSEEEQLDRISRFGYLAECNAALAKLAGAETIEELLGCRLDEIAKRIHPSVREELRTAIRTGYRTTMVETSAQDATGQQFFRLRSQFGIVENGELHRIWGTTRDISGLRRTELSLARSERSFRAVLKGIKLPAIMLDCHGRPTFVNDCFVGLAQRHRKDILEAEWLRGIVSGGESETWKKALSPDAPSDHTTFHFEGSIIPPEGPPHLIAWDTIRLLGDANELSGLAAIGTDVTVQRALELHTRQAQRLESIGRLAAGVAHDFNNLLTIVLGNANQLLKGTSESDPQREVLEAIEKAAMLCSNLTAQLLTFASKKQMRPKLISLNDLIRANESIFRGLIGGNTALILDLASMGYVNADPNQILRAVANLVTNAQDAMPSGGILTVATSNIRVGSQDPMYAGIESGPYIRLSVADTGTGFPEEIRYAIFEPFFTTKPSGKGTGLGLATVYGIATQSGGHVMAHSEPGKGARFEILLPEAQV